VRAAISQDLAYIQTKTELGWELFDTAFTDEDQRVWKYAARTLYYATGRLFARAKQYLDRMEKSQLPVVLKPWGRLSALAALEGQIPLQVLLKKLAERAEEPAWDGAISVWVANAGTAQFASDCFAGLTAAASHLVAQPSLMRRMSSLFQRQTPIPRVPLSLFRALYVYGNMGTEGGGNLPARVDEWLSRFAEADPEQALEVSEIIAGICKAKDSTPFYDHQPLGTLLTLLFREGEEREASDNGDFLRRVVALQDVFLSMPTSVLSEWLRAAERPDA
jgi:hypothetical protein